MSIFSQFVSTNSKINLISNTRKESHLKIILELLDVGERALIPTYHHVCTDDSTNESFPIHNLFSLSKINLHQDAAHIIEYKSTHEFKHFNWFRLKAPVHLDKALQTTARGPNSARSSLYFYPGRERDK